MVIRVRVFFPLLLTLAVVLFLPYSTLAAGTVHVLQSLAAQHCSSHVSTVRMVLFISQSILSTCHCSSTADSLPRAVTMSDDTEAATLRARLEAIV
jgi:hypothetical protein